MNRCVNLGYPGVWVQFLMRILFIAISSATALRNIPAIIRPGLRPPRRSGNTVTPSGPVYACRCFCATQKLAVDATSNQAFAVPDSLEYTFDPLPILGANASDLESLLNSKQNTGLRAYASESGEKTIFEFISGTVMFIGPDLTPAERMRLPQLAESLGDEAFQAYYISLLPVELRAAAEEAFQKSPFMSVAIDTPSSPLYFSANNKEAEVTRRANCIKQCKGGILSVPSYVQRLVSHKEFALVKRKKDPPIPGQILSQERPQWGRHKIPIPLLPRHQNEDAFNDYHQMRWQLLFILASRYNPATGRVQPAVTSSGEPSPEDLAIFSHFNINTDLDCQKLHQHFRATPGRATSWEELLRDFGVTRSLEEISPAGLGQITLRAPQE
eukprot:Gregarina_sp_Poly_1__5765@NODE_3032_length_1440_cov_31_632192_g1919_i0_p1_GENE_NODE_3032_length_1440_cov_31_632192_g1919_i0NODE_3032_length_1440_cov_31_632192_g1919_i0_p1_ORF_typecomplete_len385_score51_50IL11/PF07400_11/0_29_NODE_3032_length_1440_cov_31_632192_g1919_i01271281